ncbi:MAG: 30S ribosomal protein S9 [Patescibacteria group bacterium]
MPKNITKKKIIKPKVLVKKTKKKIVVKPKIEEKEPTITFELKKRTPKIEIVKAKKTGALILAGQATGKRKTSIAQIQVYKHGSGEIIVNNKDYKKYFPYFAWQKNIEDVLILFKEAKDHNFFIRVKGGGINSQSEAIRLGIAKCLIAIDNHLRDSLKSFGFLTRDSRIKERKKPGLKRARRAPQWKKR